MDHKEGWALKNWCFWTVLLKTLESPLDSKEIKPVNPEGNQLWIFIGRTDAEVEAPILWSPDGKSQLIGKDSDAGKDWGRRRRRWQRMRWLYGIINSTDIHLSKFQETVWRTGKPLHPRGHKELDMTERLNNNKMSSEKFVFIIRSKFEQSSSIKDKCQVNKKIVSLSPILLYTSMFTWTLFLIRRDLYQEPQNAWY